MEQGFSGLPPFSYQILEDVKIDAREEHPFPSSTDGVNTGFVKLPPTKITRFPCPTKAAPVAPTAHGAPGDAASVWSAYPSRHGAPQHEPPATEEVARALAPKRRLVANNHECQHCAMRFNSAFKLDQHVGTHTGDRPHACTWPECGARFVQKGNLKTHFDSVHLLLTHRCATCDHGFTAISNLNKHRKWTPACGGEKQFPCEVCTAAFRNKSDLNRHLTTSTHKKRKAAQAFPVCE